MGYYPSLVRVYVEFAHGAFGIVETWTEVTQWVTGRVRYEWGRSSAVNDFQPGKGSFTLINDDGRFDPSNTSGPYYGTLKPRRRCRITVTAGSSYQIAHGWIVGWPQRWEGRKTSYVDVEFVDALSVLSQVRMPDSVWDWRVKDLEPLLWYKLGDSAGPTVSDSSENGLAGRWAVFEGAGGAIFGQAMPKAVVEAGKTGAVIASADRQSVSWATLQSQVGQPLGGISGVPRTPVFVPSWETQYLPNQDFAVAIWVLYRQAFPVDIRNIYSSTTPIEQPLVTWGQNGVHSWRLIIRTNGKLAVEFNVGLVTLGVWDIGASLDDGRPHLISMAKTGNTMRITKDGVFQGGDILLNSPGTVVVPGPVQPAVVGAATVAPFNASGLQSTIGDVVFWDRYVFGFEFLELYYAGQYGSTDTGVSTLDTDSAFHQGFTLTGIEMFTGASFTDGQTVTETISGQSFTDYLQKLAATEQGLMFWDRSGVMTFHGRKWPLRTSSKTVQFTLGDQSGATLGYADLDYRDWSDEFQNDVTVNHPAGSERSINQASVDDYGNAAGAVDTFLADPAVAKQVANWRAWRYGTPVAEGLIPDRLTIRPNTSAEFDMVCSLDIGDRLNITRTRPNGTQIVDDYWVESIAHDFDAEQGGEWSTAVGLSPASWPADPFILDTSLLDGSDVLWI